MDAKKTGRTVKFSHSAAERAILALLEKRGAGKTICPSEAARAISGSQADWRDHMAVVHSAVDQLLAKGQIRLSWKGEKLDQRRGAYRIARR
ncbi:MAG: DUF3253 domain-containing protein [Pseudomonadota bacterium]